MASWLRTCSASASALRMSSLTKVTRFGYRVITHFRLRSVPGRLRLSSRVTCQPSLMRWIAALTPRNPAPPVIRTRRSGDELSRSSLSVTYLAFGSTAAHTLARGDAPEERDRDYPRRPRQDKGLAAGVAAARVEVRAGDEDDREDPVDDVQDALAGAVAGKDGSQAQQSLDGDQAGHDQVGRAEASAEALVAEVVVSAPHAEDEGEDDEDSRAVRVQKRERARQSGTQTGDLLAEVVDGQPKPLFEQDARPPVELLRGARVVE